LDCYRPETPDLQLAPSVPLPNLRRDWAVRKGMFRTTQWHRFGRLVSSIVFLITAPLLSAPADSVKVPLSTTADPLKGVSAAALVPAPNLTTPQSAEIAAAEMAANIITQATALYNKRMAGGTASRPASPSAFVADSLAPEMIASDALDRFRLELEQKIEAINGPDSTFYMPFSGLKAGARDLHINGPVHRLQQALLQWNNKLPLKVNGQFDEATVKSLTVFKLVYDLGHDGSFVDQATAGYILALEEGDQEELAEPQGPIGKLVYQAAQFLGLRYRLGGDGKKATDCGMLTRMAMISAGLVDEVYNRVAAMQYKYAEQGQMGLTLIDKNEEPEPGDLVFFKWNTRRARYRYKGITHVGIFLGKVGESLYVLEAHSARSSRKVTIVDRANAISRIAGYGRFTSPPEKAPLEGSHLMSD
jgi:cell wall-associated NlpC family hydrolase